MCYFAIALLIMYIFGCYEYELNFILSMNTSNNSAVPQPLLLSEKALGYLNTTRKWTKFLAILSFIGLGILLLLGMGFIFGGFFLGSDNESPFPLVFLGLVYLILVAVNIIPSWYLFSFSKNLDKMQNYRDSLKVEEAFRNLMAYYRFMGIMTIVVFGIYLIFMIIALIVGFSTMAHFIN